MNLTLGCLAVAFALGLSPIDSKAQHDSVLVREIEHFLDSENAADRFSGVIFVARGKHVLYQRAFGFADRRHDIPNHIDTKFRIASMTKMFTGVAIAQLVQAQRLKFTDAVSTLLPSYSAAWSGKVTIYQLLTHTSGLGSIWTDEFRDNPRRYRGVSDYLPLVARQSLQFSPGTDWAYSNAGYVVLGAVIEQLTGRDYRSHIRDSIFAKAGMSTLSNDDIEQNVSNRAIPYTRGGLFGSSWVSAEETGLWTMMPAGGAVLSAEDIWRFSLALMNHNLLSEAYTDSCVSGKIRYRQTASYGFGLANEYVNQDTVVFHDGGADGISANLDIFPRTGIVAVVLSNYDHPAVVPYRDKLRELATRITR